MTDVQAGADMAPASAAEALAMARAALRYLAGVEATEVPVPVQAEVLVGLEQAEAMGTAARASFLAAFSAGQGPHSDAAYSARSWMYHRARVTRAAAGGRVAWAKRLDRHGPVIAAMADGGWLSESWARTLCQWTDRLPDDCQAPADEILLAAARAGVDLAGLAEIYAEILARAVPPDPDGDRRRFGDRSVRLETTFDGAGVLGGDLTPECSAFVGAVLDALSVPEGAADDRTKEQRYHDGLMEAMRRLLASGLLPERAGQPVKALALMSLADLRAMDTGSRFQDAWTERVRGQWAAARASAAEGGGTGGAWLDGDSARAMACDASITPVVTGQAAPGILDNLVALCVQLAGHGRHCTGPPPDQRPDSPPGQPRGCGPPAAQARAMLERAIIGKAADLLSGPEGLAGFLRRSQLGARLAGPSLPLDIGFSKDIPAAIRRAVMLRDRHCRFPAGCTQPARACEVHHVRHLEDGGETSTCNCILLCAFHHQVVIHRWGWTLELHPDGTVTARNPDGTKVLHSHSPPAQAA